MAAATPRADTIAARTIDRALDSRGSSDSDALLGLVRALVQARGTSDVVVDMGCGTGRLHDVLAGCYRRYVGVDVVRHAGFPDAPDAEFVQLDLDRADGALPAHTADVVCCVETIEHLENPRALARQLDRLARPGALIIVTTPNQLSLLSKLSLVLKNEFVHFQEGPGLYPAHVTALLECDLRRIAQETGWQDVAVHYSGEGRIPGIAARWPRWLTARTGWRGRAFSDNIVLSAVTGLP
jgi:SAM-dependent methyltransferase